MPYATPNSVVVQHSVILPLQYLGRTATSNNNNSSSSAASGKHAPAPPKTVGSSNASLDAIAAICQRFVAAERSSQSQLLVLFKYVYGPLAGTPFAQAVADLFPEAQQQLQLPGATGASGTGTDMVEASSGGGDDSPLLASPMNAIGLKPETAEARQKKQQVKQQGASATTLLLSPEGLVAHTMTHMDREAVFSNLPQLFKRHTALVQEMLAPATTSTTASAANSILHPGENSALPSPNVALLRRLLQIPSDQQQPSTSAAAAVAAAAGVEEDSDDVVDPAVVLQAMLGLRVFNPRTQTTPSRSCSGSFRIESQSQQQQQQQQQHSRAGSGWFPAIPQHMRYLSGGGYTSRSQANLMFGGDAAAAAAAAAASGIASATPAGARSHLRDGSDEAPSSSGIPQQQQGLHSRQKSGAGAAVAAMSSPAHLVLPDAVDDFLSELYLYGCNFFRRGAPMLVALIDLVAKLPPGALSSSGSGTNSSRYADPVQLEAALAAATAAERTDQFGAASFDALTGMPTWSSDRLKVVHAISGLADRYEMDGGGGGAAAPNSIFRQVSGILPELDPAWLVDLQRIVVAREAAAEQGLASFVMPPRTASTPGTTSISRLSPAQQQQQQKRDPSPAPAVPDSADQKLLPGGKPSKDNSNNNGGKGGAQSSTSESPPRAGDFVHSASLPLHWLLFLLAAPIRSLRRLHAFAQDVLAVYATSGVDPIYSLHPEAEMASLAQFIHRMELQLLEFDQLCYESCSMLLTRTALRRFDVVGPNPLPPHPGRVLLLRGYVQKKIPNGRHTKILMLFDDLLVYGEDTEAGRIKVTTAIPLMALPAAKDESGPGFFARLFGGGKKKEGSSGGGDDALKQSASSYQDNDPEAERAMKSIRDAPSAARMEPYILRVRDVPDDVAGGVVPSAYDQGAATDARSGAGGGANGENAGSVTATYFRTNAFEITTRTRSYVFYTPTVTEKAQWLAALRYAMEASRERHGFSAPATAVSTSSDAAAAAAAAASSASQQCLYSSVGSSDLDDSTVAAALPVNAAVRETAKRLSYLHNGYEAEVANFREIETRSTTKAGVTHMVFDGCAVQLSLFPSEENRLTGGASQPEQQQQQQQQQAERGRRLDTANLRLEKLLRRDDSRFMTQLGHGITHRGGSAAVLTPREAVAVAAPAPASGLQSPALVSSSALAAGAVVAAPPLSLRPAAAAAAAAAAGTGTPSKAVSAKRRRPSLIAGGDDEDDDGEGGLLGGTIRSLAADDEIAALADELGD